MKYIPLLLLLSACSTTATPPPPQPEVRTVEVPVVVTAKCKPDIPATPDYPDTDAALVAASTAVPGVAESVLLFNAVKLLLAGRQERIAREGQLNAALAGCAQ